MDNEINISPFISFNAGNMCFCIWAWLVCFLFNVINLLFFLCAHRKVRDLRWLAEATYTGEALDFALKNTISLMRQDNRVVLVLTDGRSDTDRDTIPLNILCGQNVRVSTIHLHRHRLIDPLIEILTGPLEIFLTLWKPWCDAIKENLPLTPGNLKISFLISRWVV